MLKLEFMPRKTWPDRFWAKVDKNGPVPEHCPELGQCWVWTAMKNHKGYGYVRFNRKNVSSHRMSWFLYAGTWPAGFVIMHKCDNRACVNPDHLAKGSVADNNRDMVEKGRQNFGKVISDELLLVILAEIQSGQGIRATARKHGISRNTIRTAIRKAVVCNTPTSE